MTTGQPIKVPSDRNKYNNDFMESLQLQINLNQKNLEVNRLYKETGQLPASTQMMDTRSNEEKLMDTQYLKQQIISDLAPIAEPMFASAVIQGVINSPLNVDNSLFRYLAQNAQTFAQTLSKKYKFGIAGDANDVEIMVQFLEDAFVKTKNTFQSIKGYINSNTNEGNKSRSNILSANDTDNLIIELKDVLKRLKGLPIANFTPAVIESILIVSDIITDVLEFLPSSEQMRVIIDLITSYASNMLNANGQPNPPNPLDPRNLDYGQLGQNGIITAVLKILSSSIPKLSSVQTIIDRLYKALNKNDNRLIAQSSTALVNLFSTFNKPENRAILTQFKNEYINRANVEIRREVNLNQINTIDEIRRMNQNEENEKRAQRVYVVNPADDAVNVNGIGYGGSDAGDDSTDYSGWSTVHSGSTDYSGHSTGSSSVHTGFSTIGSAGSAGSADIIPPLAPDAGMTRDDYIDFNVDRLTPDGLRALVPAILNNANMAPYLTPANIIRLQGNLIGMGRQEKADYLKNVLKNLPNRIYDPRDGNNPINFLDVGGPAGISGLGLKKVKKGRGLYSPFGDSEINHKNLENNILTLRRKTKTNYMDLPSKHISKHMKNIITNIVGGKIANFEDIHNLNDEERNYLSKVVKKSNLQDRLSVPAPSKDQAEKDNHQWEVMRGEIMAGNDSHELVKKFKILTMKLTRQGLLPKNEVMDLFEDLVNLGY